MLALVKAQVWKYKSIEDSTPVDLASSVTVLVGKNESGKTAFLEALHKALPLSTVKYDYVADYPRKDLVRYRPQHEAKDYKKVVELVPDRENSRRRDQQPSLWGSRDCCRWEDLYAQHNYCQHTYYRF